MAKNCGVTAAKIGTYVEQSWKDTTERCSLPRSCFLDVTPSSPNVTSKKQLRERL